MNKLPVEHGAEYTHGRIAVLGPYVLASRRCKSNKKEHQEYYLLNTNLEPLEFKEIEVPAKKHLQYLGLCEKKGVVFAIALYNVNLAHLLAISHGRLVILYPNLDFKCGDINGALWLPSNENREELLIYGKDGLHVTKLE